MIRPVSSVCLLCERPSTEFYSTLTYRSQQLRGFVALSGATDAFDVAGQDSCASLGLWWPTLHTMPEGSGMFAWWVFSAPGLTRSNTFIMLTKATERVTLTKSEMSKRWPAHSEEMQKSAIRSELVCASARRL